MAAEPLIDDMNKAQLFFEKGSSGKEVYIDYDIYQQIIDLLISQAGKESDPKTCEEIYCIVNQLRVRAFDEKNLSEKVETDTGDVEVLRHTFIDRKTRQKIIEIFKADAHTASEIIETLPDFVAMLQGPGTNGLSFINSNCMKPEVSFYNGEGKLRKGTLTVFIDRYNELTGELRPSAQKLLDACTIILTQQNKYRGEGGELKTRVIIPLERYMEFCGIPLTKASKDKTRRKVKEDLDTLFHIFLEWTETSGRTPKDFSKMRICDEIDFDNGNIIFSFSMSMARYLTNSYIMQYPMELLKVDERNPNSYCIGKKLSIHNSIDNNKRKGTAHILSVKSLLDVCPDIPTYEQVLAKGRQLEQRIKKPLETALNSLNFISWEYCNSKGVPLTEEQLQATDYSTFINLYIKFDVLGAPDQTARLEARAEEAKAQEEKKKRRTSKKKAEETN